MRPKFDVRTGRAMVALGALGFGSTGAAVGPLVAHAAGASAAAAPIVDGSAQRVAYDHAAVVSGKLANGSADVPVVLQFQAGGTSTWTDVAKGRTGPGGVYRLRAILQRSGLLRVTPGGSIASAASAGSAGGTVVPVAVGAGIRARVPRPDQLAGHSFSVRGVVRTPQPGRTVVLQERHGRRWINVSHARTNARGAYRMRFAPHGLGSHQVRVRFAGDQVNGPATSPTTVANVYREAGASWYGPGGGLACGGSLTDSTMGVANKTLPCGTMVTLHLGHRTVRVPVIDRGPYVAGRDYDLTPATKRALGFGDTGKVWATA